LSNDFEQGTFKGLSEFLPALETLTVGNGNVLTLVADLWVDELDGTASSLLREMYTQLGEVDYLRIRGALLFLLGTALFPNEVIDKVYPPDELGGGIIAENVRLRTWFIRQLSPTHWDAQYMEAVSRALFWVSWFEKVEEVASHRG
jgi:hypothetical protein